MASSVVLATLAVPPYDRKHGAHHFELEMEKDRNVRMANILGFNIDAKKDSREVVSDCCEDTRDVISLPRFHH
jgi:translation initiation factor 3 subunit A